MADRYEVIDVVGAGGMATVWRAHDRELGRMVAIKRPHPAPADSTTHERFRREARAAAAVNHPNLVTVYDAAVDDQGPYLVMELVDAPSLAQSSVEPRDAAAIGAALARALAALHAADIVHRDIKPSNILLASGGPQLTDFGIARSLDASDDVTQAGLSLGTPSYAPPETLAGGVSDAAGDVYSLAVVVHEIVTGERLAGQGGTRVMVTDRFLQPVLEPALSADPSERPTAAEFAESLESIPTDALEIDRTQAFAVVPEPGASAEVSRSPGVDMIGATRTSTAASDLHQRWESTDRHSQWLFVFLGACAVLAVSILFVGVMAAGDDERPSDTASAVPVADGAGAAPSPDDALAVIASAREAFDGYVAGLSSDVLEENDGRKVLDEVAEAIDSAAEGDLERAQERFDDVAERLTDDVSDETARNESVMLLVALAASVGITLEPTA